MQISECREDTVGGHERALAGPEMPGEGFGQRAEIGVAKAVDRAATCFDCLDDGVVRSLIEKHGVEFRARRRTTNPAAM